MAYATVGDVIAQVRVLLEDSDTDLQRYSDAILIQQLNSGLLDSKRIRPDLYRGASAMGTVPQYQVSDIAGNTPIAYDSQFIPTLVYYVAGLAQLSDSEEPNDERATAMIQVFGKGLTGVP